MIISHKYKFIFIKTVKTAGTSIEIFLSQHCGDEDIVTPIEPPDALHRPRHYKGWFNPLPELLMNRGQHIDQTFRDLRTRRRFYNHIPARLVKARVDPHVWNNYFKFCVERNPWDKSISYYYMLKHRAGGTLSWDEYLAGGSHPRNDAKYTDHAGNILVDQIVRYETLTEELSAIFSRLHIPFDGSLGVNAKSDYRDDRRPYHEVLTPQQMERVAVIFQQEIALLGYSA